MKRLITDKHLKYFQHKLEDLRSEYAETAQSISEGLRTQLTDSVGEISSYDNHPADLGDATFEREKDLALKLLTEEQLGQIEDALSAIQTGDYGICRSCGRAISLARLEALPFAPYCVACQEKSEETLHLRRPVEEEVIKMPFGAPGGFPEDNNAFDGEDSWQAVARYGTSNSPPDTRNDED